MLSPCDKIGLMMKWMVRTCIHVGKGGSLVQVDFYEEIIVLPHL